MTNTTALLRSFATSVRSRVHYIRVQAHGIPVAFACRIVGAWVKGDDGELVDASASRATAEDAERALLAMIVGRMLVGPYGDRVTPSLDSPATSEEPAR